MMHSRAYFCPNPSKQNISITLVHFWTNVEDVGPAWYKCYTNASGLLGFGSFFCFWDP